MSDKIYMIIHQYDVDGGFGDAIPREEVLWTTTSKALAEAYVAKWNDTFVYDQPYADLEKNTLDIREMVINNFSVDTMPSIDSHYEVRATVDPDAYKQRQRELDERKKQYERERKALIKKKQANEWKSQCEACGCTFTPAD